MWLDNCRVNLTEKVQRTHNSKCNEESCALWSKNSTDVEWQQTIWISADTISRLRCEVSWFKVYRCTVHIMYVAICTYVRRVSVCTYMQIYIDTRQPQRQDCLPIAFWFSKYDSPDSYVVTYARQSPLPTGVVMWPACDLYTGTLHRGEGYKLKPHLPCHPIMYKLWCKDHSCVRRSMICGG